MSEGPPIVVLGAARSGTKLLRSLIAAGGVAEVPFDVNYIWRFGNDRSPHDALPAAAAVPAVREFIRSRLPRAAGLGSRSAERYVEKTVGNVLRVPFVERVLPEAYFVVLVRDGRDVVESAMRSWQEAPRVGYLARKLRTFPWLRAAPYAVRYAGSVAGRMFGVADQVRTWGPRYPGIDRDVRDLPLLDVCARQWKACMEALEESMPGLPEDRTAVVRYEELVADPAAETTRLADRLGLPDGDAAAGQARTVVVATNRGKHSALAADQQDRLFALIGPVLQRWGYS